jgi:glutaredoxin 2
MDSCEFISITDLQMKNNWKDLKMKKCRLSFVIEIKNMRANFVSELYRKIWNQKKKNSKNKIEGNISHSPVLSKNNRSDCEALHGTIMRTSSVSLQEGLIISIWKVFFRALLMSFSPDCRWKGSAWGWQHWGSCCWVWVWCQSKTEVHSCACTIK